MESIAIIGTGISAMAAGFFLKDYCDVTFFEKNDYPGGHTNTVLINEDGHNIPIDTGFMVFNEVTYPQLLRLFKHLQIDAFPTSMSFSVQHRTRNLEYNGAGLMALFAQRRNLFRPAYWQMLFEMDRFNNDSKEVLADESKFWDMSVKEYLELRNYRSPIFECYLMPMSSAVWSMSPDDVEGFPIVTLVRFFYNHGFLGLSTHHQWYTLTNGSRVYRDKILSMFDRVHLNRPIVRVKSDDVSVELTDNSGSQMRFDRVIMACHGDQALKILAEPTDLEQKLLSQVRYQKNRVIMHHDESIMPKRRHAWASWNYLMDRSDSTLKSSVIYYMNELQNVSKNKKYFISVDDPGWVRDDQIIWEREYEHPIYHKGLVTAQKDFQRLNENGRLYYCGAYFNYGFHEDGLNAGMAVAAKIRCVDDVWQGVDDEKS